MAKTACCTSRSFSMLQPRITRGPPLRGWDPCCAAQGRQQRWQWRRRQLCRRSTGASWHSFHSLSLSALYNIPFCFFVFGLCYAVVLHVQRAPQDWGPGPVRPLTCLIDFCWVYIVCGLIYMQETNTRASENEAGGRPFPVRSCPLPQERASIPAPVPWGTAQERCRNGRRNGAILPMT